MSSGRPAEPRLRRWRGRFGRLPLRTRLVAAVIGLLAVVCLILGVATQFAVRGFLTHQIDDQLAAAGNRSVQGAPGSGPRPQGDPRDFPPITGQGAGTLQARLINGSVDRASLVLGDLLPEQDYPVLAALPTDGRPYTRALGDLGNYRLVATREPDGDVVVTGLPLHDLESTLTGLAAVEAGIALAGLLLTGLAGAVIVRRSLRPLNRVAATASRVAELPLDRGEVALSVRVPDVDTDPRTEVGRVGAALNRMLGHVGAALTARQASETRVRQFLADASHELRTPLAAIRGYAELVRRFDAQVPDDVARAMRRVDSESTRMTALVEDMLLLARLDSGRPLTTGPVDLSRLAVDAVSDAHVAGPRHHWRIELPDEAVTVPGDPARLHQVLANLLGNARTHTPAGTTVTVGLTAPAAGTVRLRVADDGPGIPAALLPDVFDRFARADTSRSRAAGSTGLGLSIVDAVVQAHGGRVEVDSAPGRTVFTVTLPARAPAAGSGLAAGASGKTPV
jgi:two-component system OmpR family sensor kinase